MKWRGSAWWLGVTVVSLAFGAALLCRPKSPSRSRPAPSQEKGTPAVEARIATEPATPPARRAVTLPRPSASAPLIASAVRPALTAASPARQEAPAATPSVVAAPTSSPVAPVLSAKVAPQAVVGSPRRASFTPLSTWTKPGLCATSAEAEATREKLTARFRRLPGESRAQLYFDPRLPPGAETNVLFLLAYARAEVQRQLGLDPPAPPTFVYLDQELLKAAACVNEDVVAFYDGALHLVANRPDLKQSAMHEFTHHALFSSGVVGPAWAQEGIAMLVARETWWQAPARVQALLSAPFSAEQMDELIPYKLRADQAVSFYVQAALTVQCLLTRRGWSLQQLAETLRNGSGPDSVSYDIPELQERSFLSGCATAGPH